MLSEEQLIEKALQKFKESDGRIAVRNAFITETTDHTPIIVLRDDNRVLANYQVLNNDELLRLDKISQK